jgi:hypothetical protein
VNLDDTGQAAEVEVDVDVEVDVGVDGDDAGTLQELLVVSQVVHQSDTAEDVVEDRRGSTSEKKVVVVIDGE